MMTLRFEAGACGHLTRSNCKLCGSFVGWKDYPDVGENRRKWNEFAVSQQAKHDAAWRRQIDAMQLEPMR
jgi:hypothetical protein